MGSQLHLVAPDRDPPAVAAGSFRVDARLRLWSSGLCALLAIGMTALGYRRALHPALAGPLAAAFLLWSLYLLTTFTGRRSVRYRLTAQRLEVERGVFGKRFESVDLWRVRDLVLEQTLLERMRGVGRITVLSSDQVEPELLVGPVASARELYDQLRDAVAAARREARVVPLA